MLDILRGAVVGLFAVYVLAMVVLAAGPLITELKRWKGGGK